MGKRSLLGFDKALSRRAFVIGGSAVAGAAICAPAYAQAKTIRVGVSLGLSGSVAGVGESILSGAKLYEKAYASSLPAGVKVELIIRDDGASPDNARRIAQELIVRDRVQLLTGMSISPQAFSLAPVITSAKIPLIVTGAATSSVTRASPYIVRVSETFWQTSHTLGQWAAGHGFKRVYTLVADYASGLDVENAFNTGYAKGGGQIVGSVRVPVATTDYLPFMHRIKEANPDAVMLFVNTGRTASAMKAFTDAGLKQAGVTMLGTAEMSTDDEIAKMGDEVIGLVSASPYQVQSPAPANKEFLADWQKQYGADAVPNFLSVCGWDGLAAIYSLVRETKGDFDGDKALSFLSRWATDKSPRGKISIDPETRDIVQTIYISRVEKVGGRPTSVIFDKVDAVKDPWKALNPPGPKQ